MDGFQLFKKLVVGAKFDFKRFHNDAERLKIVSPICTQDKTKLPDVAKDKQVIEVHAAKTQHITTSEESSSKKRKSTLQEHKKPKKIKKDEPEDTSSDDNGQVDTSNADDSNSEDSDDDDDIQNQQTVAELQILGNITSSGDITSQTSKRLKKKTKKKTSTKLADLKQEEINHLRNVSKIHTYGYDIPDPVSSFTQLQSEYDLHPTLIENIQSVGYSTPTSIQMQAVPVMLLRRDLMACAPTGSGKTAAFIIPILHHLKEPRNLGFRALILAPTRELAKQTTREFQRLAEGRGFRIYYMDKASTAIKKFGPKAKRKFDILVTTPNRLVYLLNQSPPVISLNSIEWLVVDESDKLFEEGKTGFRDQLAEIYKACDSGNVRRAMFSATFAYEVEEWCKLNLDNVVQVYVGARNSATENIEQELVFVGTESGKLLAMRNLIQKGIQPPVLIFVQSKERAKELFHELIYEGISVDVMHADRTQLQRDNIVKCFRCGKIWVLICTELMGRGMDFKGINLVINYDFPNSAISYIHRIGRTGRAGHTGKAITFFTDDDTVNLRSIANVMKEAGCPVPDYMLHMKPPDKKTRKHLSHSKKIRDRISTTPLQDLQKQNWKKKLNKDVKRKQKMSHGQLKTKKTFEKTKNTSSKILSTSKHNESKAVKKMKHKGNLKNKAQKSR